MKSLRSYLTTLDRSATAQPRQNGRKKIYRAILATTLVAGSQLLSAISAIANTAPNPVIPSPILPTRILLNGSFETPAQSRDAAGYGINEAYTNTPPIIWRTTEPGNSNGTYRDQLEVWRGVNTGAGGQTTMGLAYPGDTLNKQYAEINASTNASIYQDLCVLPSETINWSLLHAARKNGSFASGNPTNIMQVSITDPTLWVNSKTPPIAQSGAYYSPQLSVAYSDGWKPQSGSWTSSNSSPKELRFAFGAIQGSNSLSYGNFIDNVQLSLSPLIDFLPPDPSLNVNIATTQEGNRPNGNYYYLSLRINGEMKTNGTVRIALSGLNSRRSFRLGTVRQGTATLSGLTATKDAGANVIRLNIPAGIYNPNAPSDYIHIPIDFSDNIIEPNDNLTFTLDGVDSGNLTTKSSQCTTDRLTVETRLIDDDSERRVELPVKLPIRIAAH